jgi:hypothetical protein
MSRPLLPRPVSLAALAPFALALACETETPSSAILENGSSAVVYRAWWSETVFEKPVAPGGASEQLRTVPSTDFAYVLLAPGWNAASAASPTSLVVLRSKVPLSLARGDTLHVAVSDATFDGNCGAGDPLSQAEADRITQTIFAGDLAGLAYDAATCTTKPIADAAAE